MKLSKLTTRNISQLSQMSIILFKESYGDYFSSAGLESYVTSYLSCKAWRQQLKLPNTVVWGVFSKGGLEGYIAINDLSVPPSCVTSKSAVKLFCLQRLYVSTTLQ
ncbi:MAG: hypothetical protein ACKO34_04015, partial [Vampirovibrionales bacterium]